MMMMTCHFGKIDAGTYWLRPFHARLSQMVECCCPALACIGWRPQTASLRSLAPNSLVPQLK